MTCLGSGEHAPCKLKGKYLKNKDGAFEFLGSGLLPPSSKLRDDHVWKEPKEKEVKNVDNG